MSGTVRCDRCKRVGAVRNCLKCAEAQKEAAASKRKKQPELPMTEKVIKLEFHPIAETWPLMEGDDFKVFADDIETKGQRLKIWLYEGKIIDGRNRYLACLDRNIDPQIDTYKGDDPVGFSESLNDRRRHMTVGQRAIAAAKMAKLKPGDNQHTKEVAGKPATSQVDAAEKLKISRDSVQAATTVLEKGSKVLIDAVQSGSTPLSPAATVADALPKKEQAAAVKSGTVPEVAKKVRAKRKKKVKTEPARQDQPSLPKTGRKQPHVEPTKKGRPTEFGMLADLETAERCVKELQQIRASLDFLARHGNGTSEIANNVFGTDDQDGIYLLHEMKRPDPANHNMITPFMTCEALEGFLTRMFLIGHEIIRLHGADEVVDRGETITF